MSQDSLRRAMGVVPQDTVLFNDTIGYNIAYGDLAASEEQVKEVAAKAKLDSSIDRMPDVRFCEGLGRRSAAVDSGRVLLGNSFLDDPRFELIKTFLWS